MAAGKQSEYIEKFGRLWKRSEGANDLNINLACYRIIPGSTISKKPSGLCGPRKCFNGTTGAT